jgi:hypothetical protein
MPSKHDSNSRKKEVDLATELGACDPRSGHASDVAVCRCDRYVRFQGVHSPNALQSGTLDNNGPRTRFDYDLTHHIPIETATAKVPGSS